jgi:hypothetical protein
MPKPVFVKMVKHTTTILKLARERALAYEGAMLPPVTRFPVAAQVLQRGR